MRKGVLTAVFIGFLLGTTFTFYRNINCEGFFSRFLSYCNTTTSPAVASRQEGPIKEPPVTTETKWVWVLQSGKGIGRERLDKAISDVLRGICEEGILKIEDGHLKCETLRIDELSVDVKARLQDMDDVDVKGAVSGNALVFDGQKWVAGSIDIPRYTTEGSLLQLQGTRLSLREGVLKDAKLCLYSAVDGLVCNVDPSTLDTQTLKFYIAGLKLSIENGNSVDLSPLLQSLSLTGDTLTISGANSITFLGWDTDASDDIKNFTDLLDTPPDYGTAGYLLETDGSGSLQWIDPSTLDVGQWVKSATAVTLRNSSDHVVIDSSLGIGTVTPLVKLYIYDICLGE